MMLEDGRWKIKQMERVDASACKETTTPNEKTIKASATGFEENGEKFVVSGFNYYPKSFSWTLFWENYQDSIVEKDFEIIKSLKMNSLRVFIPYEDFGAETPTEGRLSSLQSFLDKAQSYNIKIIVTLFDFPPSYEYNQWTRSERHLETILKNFKDHQAILAWDLKNEIDLDYDSYGEENVNEWIQYMLSRMSIYDPNHLITIGWSDPKYASQFSEQLDFISFHYYKNISLFEEDLLILKNEVPDKHLVLGEFGLSSYSSYIFPIAGTNYKQAVYYNKMFAHIDQHQMSYLAWTLHDFVNIPSNIFGFKPWIKNSQAHFGIIASEGKNKASFDIFENREFVATKSWKDFVPPFIVTYLSMFLLSLMAFFLFKALINRK